jgi:hypothetical protein
MILTWNAWAGIVSHDATLSRDRNHVGWVERDNGLAKIVMKPEFPIHCRQLTWLMKHPSRVKRSRGTPFQTYELLLEKLWSPYIPRPSAPDQQSLGSCSPSPVGPASQWVGSRQLCTLTIECLVNHIIVKILKNSILTWIGSQWMCLRIGEYDQWWHTMFWSHWRCARGQHWD